MALKVLPKASKTLARRLLTSLGVIRPAKPGALKGLQIQVKVPSKYSSRPPNQSLLIFLTLYLSFLFFPVLFSSCLFFSLSLSRSLSAGLLRFFSRSRFPFPGLTGSCVSEAGRISEKNAKIWRQFHVLGKFRCPQSASKGLPKQTPRDQPRQAFRRPSNSPGLTGFRFCLVSRQK